MPRLTSFAELGVPAAIVDALESAGIRQPFPIQAETIPDLLAGRDVIGRAPTGSGKTLAFGIPLVARADAAGPARKKRPRALVLAPTRELAGQIADELAPLLAAVDRHGLAVYGGVGLQPQINRLAKGVDVLVATPGRLEDLIGQRVVSLAEVEAVVLDEADRMADMGFMPAVRRILDQTVACEQTVLYSATLDREVAKITADYQENPIRHEIGDPTPDLEKMTHYFWTVERGARIPLCASVIATFGRTIVFSRTRHGADRAARQLSRAGVPAVPIHGNRSQSQRQRALDDFAKGKAAALVATDVAARGIHVDAVECVVHFDPPDEDSAYVHRSGRTARAGARGTVVSFVDPAQTRLVTAMKKRLDLPQEITPPPHIDGDPIDIGDSDRDVALHAAPEGRADDRRGSGSAGSRSTGKAAHSGSKGSSRSSSKKKGERPGSRKKPGKRAAKRAAEKAKKKSNRQQNNRSRDDRSQDSRSRDNRPTAGGGSSDGRAARSGKPGRAGKPAKKARGGGARPSGGGGGGGKGRPSGNRSPGGGQGRNSKSSGSGGGKGRSSGAARGPSSGRGGANRQGRSS
ncbi:MAG: DEAD/DEAH box helicase [Actinomycetota bacterium]